MVGVVIVVASFIVEHGDVDVGRRGRDMNLSEGAICAVIDYVYETMVQSCKG